MEFVSGGMPQPFRNPYDASLCLLLNMQCTDRYLIIGADSRIGSSVLSQLESEKLPAMGTTRRVASIGPKNQFLDLDQSIKRWQIPENIRGAVLCAGITRIGECEQHPRHTHRINVERLFELARRLIDQGVFVIQISTNQVFGGHLSFPSLREALTPVNEYGRQKARFEELLRAYPDMTAIVRMTKILSSDNPLFKSWSDSLSAGVPIQPFENVRFSPVPVAYAAFGLVWILKNKRPGTYHISAERDITYAQAAEIGAHAMGYSKNLIKPIRAKDDFGILPDRHTALETYDSVKAFGQTPPTVEWTIKTAFSGIDQLGDWPYVSRFSKIIECEK